MNNQNKVSGQFIQETIPQSRECECARCQMLEVKIEYLKGLMQGWDKTAQEIRVESVNEFMREVINNQFYSKDTLISFYRNYTRQNSDNWDAWGNECNNSIELK